MAATIVGTTASTVQRVIAPIIEIKEKWSQAWSTRTDLEFITARVTSAGHDLPKLECRRLYGRVKRPAGTAIANRKPIDIVGWWLRLRLIGKNGAVTSWVGRIETESRKIHAKATDPGPPAKDIPSGEQRWVAYGADQILRKVGIGESIWLRDGAAVTIGWVPGMNARDELRMIVGNRSSTRTGSGQGSYVYGGTDTWNRLEYVEYILKHFVEAGADGPWWQTAGQSGLLRNITDTVSFSGTETAMEILRKLISTRHGLDFRIVPNTSAGFDVEVFSLNDKSYTVGNVTMPANPRKVTIKVPSEKHLVSTHIVRSHEHKHGLIRVVGRRIVVCCSLRGAEAPDSDTSLIGKWGPVLESLYKVGAGLPPFTARNHDAARLNERYRPVYQFFGAPKNWDWQEGLARVEQDGAGNIAQVSSNDYQDSVRRTLSTLPLLEGLDYSTDPPGGTVPDDHEAEYRSPEVFVYEEPDGEEGDRYVTAENLGIGISVPGNDWGVILSVPPNHLLALNHWDGAEKSLTQPEYDHEKLVATIALETDKRFELNHQIPGSSGTAEEGVLFIEAPDCELWYLAPDTVVGVNEDGTLKKSPTAGVVLRNDANRMALILAGAIARYGDDRIKAELVYEGLRSYSGLVGQILEVIEQGGIKHPIGVPITSVEWRAAPIEGREVSGEGGRQVTTTIKTGFAR